MTYTELKDKIFSDYEIRKGSKRKLAFISFVKELCAEHGLSFRVEESRSLVTSRNIVIGDPEAAERIVTAHYDTCAAMPFPNFITPRNLFFYLLSQLLMSALLFAPPIAVFLLLINYTELIILPLILLYAMLFGMMFLLMAGPANKHTANDNTSGVVCVLASALRNIGNTKTAYILFDNEEMGMLGSAAYAAAHKKLAAEKLVINLDCISDGDNMLLHIKSKLRREPEFEHMAKHFSDAVSFGGKKPVVPERGLTLYPSDQANFKRGVAVASLKRSKLLGLYMDRIHTHRDVIFDDKNIECVLDFIDKLNSAVY